MVDYSTLTELELYRDGQTGEFIARDPSDGTEYAVPFEELNAGTANIDSLGQSVDAGSNDITNAGSVDANSVSTGSATTDRIYAQSTGEGIRFDEITLDDNSTENISSRYGGDFKVHGFIIISKTAFNNSTGTFLVDGLSTTKLGESIEGEFGTSQGASDVNFYYNGSDFILENQEGGGQSFRVVYLGTQ